MGIQTYGGKTKLPLLSDLVLHEFDHAWLRLVFPELLDKPAGRTMHQLDGILYLTKSASAVTAYVLGAAVLFDSADEALATLTDASLKESSPAKRDRNPALDSKALRESYVVCEGDHRAVAATLKQKLYAVTGKLNSLGRPDFKSRTGDVGGFLTAFLCDRMSFQDARTASGLTQRRAEHVLRIIAGQFVPVMREIGQFSHQRARKSRPLPPHEIKPSNFAPI